MPTNFSELILNSPLRERQTTSDYVAQVLRKAILNGQLEAGTELNQVELADYFRVSRIPVREALKHLQAEGLISAEAHHRAVVLGLNIERIIEIFELRALLETHLLKKVASVFDATRLQELRALCDEMDALGEQRHDEWLKKNREFHRWLYEPAEAQMTLTLIEQLILQVQRYLQREGGVDRAAQAGSEHRRILDALEAQDIDQAASLLEEHLMHTRDQIVALLQQSNRAGTATMPATTTMANAAPANATPATTPKEKEGARKGHPYIS